MNLGLLEANASNPEDVSQMFDANDLAHQQVIAAIMAQGVNIVPQSWPMAVAYPPDPSWVDHHAQEHTLWSQILGVENPGDLNQYDLNNPRQFARWIGIHVQHHQAINQALGLL
jgi:hypothetical protein